VIVMEEARTDLQAGQSRHAHLVAAQAEMRRFLGRETLAALHRESRVLDVCTLVFVPSMSVMIVVICGLYDHFLLLGAVLAQGWLLQ